MCRKMLIYTYMLNVTMYNVKDICIKGSMDNICILQETGEK